MNTSKKLAALLVFLPGMLALGYQQQEQPRRPEAPNGLHTEIPELIPGEEWRPNPQRGAAPTWMRADQLVDEFGLIDRELLEVIHGHHFTTTVIENHEQALKAFNESEFPPPCVPWGNPIGSYPTRPLPEPSTIQDLVDTAAFVATGTVEETVGGLSGNTGIGTMLLVRVDTWKGRESFPLAESVLVFWPAGEVQIGHASICARADGFPDVPSLGDHVVIFPENGYVTTGSPFISAMESRYGEFGAALYFSEDGRARSSAMMAMQIPSITRTSSFASFNSQLDAAVSRSVLR